MTIEQNTVLTDRQQVVAEALKTSTQREGRESWYLLRLPNGEGYVEVRTGTRAMTLTECLEAVMRMHRE